MCNRHMCIGVVQKHGDLFYAGLFFIVPCMQFMMEDGCKKTFRIVILRLSIDKSICMGNK